MKNKIKLIEPRFFSSDELEKQKDFESILAHYKIAKKKTWSGRSYYTWVALGILACCTLGVLGYLNSDNTTPASDFSVPDTKISTLDRASAAKSNWPISNASIVEKIGVTPQPEAVQTSKSAKKPESELPISKKPTPASGNLASKPMQEIESELKSTGKVEETDPKAQPILIEEAHPLVGFENLYIWFEQNITYPEVHRKDAIEGSVKVAFIVNKDSTISEIQVIQSLGKAFDQEAVRLVEEMPKWVPSRRNGIPFAKRLVLPIGFKIESH